MTSEALSELARLGIGTVFWKVPPRKIEAAGSLARELAGEGQARLEVVSKPAEMPWLTLTGPPRSPDSDALSDVVEALIGHSGEVDWSSPETLEKLSWIPRSERGWPTLRRHRAASFLLLSPAKGGKIDPETTHLSSVFIDGLEVRGPSQ